MNQPTEESKGGETPTDYSNMPPLIDIDDRDEEGEIPPTANEQADYLSRILPPNAATPSTATGILDQPTTSKMSALTPLLDRLSTNGSLRRVSGETERLFDTGYRQIQEDQHKREILEMRKQLEDLQQRLKDSTAQKQVEMISNYDKQEPHFGKWCKSAMVMAFNDHLNDGNSLDDGLLQLASALRNLNKCEGAILRTNMWRVLFRQPRQYHEFEIVWKFMTLEQGHAQELSLVTTPLVDIANIIDAAKANKGDAEYTLQNFNQKLVRAVNTFVNATTHVCYKKHIFV